MISLTRKITWWIFTNFPTTIIGTLFKKLVKEPKLEKRRSRIDPRESSDYSPVIRAQNPTGRAIKIHLSTGHYNRAFLYFYSRLKGLVTPT